MNQALEYERLCVQLEEIHGKLESVFGWLSELLQTLPSEARQLRWLNKRAWLLRQINELLENAYPKQVRCIQILQDTGTPMPVEAVMSLNRTMELLEIYKTIAESDVAS